MKSVFYNYRASVIFDQQLNLFKESIDYEDSVEFRNKIFKDSIKKMKVNEKSKILYKDKELIYFASNMQDDFFKIELGRKKIIEKIIPTDIEFAAEIDETYPPISIYINKNNQIIFIEGNDNVMKHSIAKEYVQEIINNNLADQPYKILLSPISSTPKFWKHINDENLRITEVSFDLLAPNFLSANSEAKDIVKQLHSNNNAEKFCIKLISETGLVIKEEEFNSYVDYTSEGAGVWSIKAINKKTKRKVTYKQKNSIKRTSVSLIDDGDKITMEIRLIKDLRSDGEKDE